MLFPAMPGLSAPVGPALPAAVPAYEPDVDAAHRALGQAHLYIAQLAALLRARADETNQLHEDKQALEHRVAALEAENEALGAAVEQAARTRLTALQNEPRDEGA